MQTRRYWISFIAILLMLVGPSQPTLWAIDLPFPRFTQESGKLDADGLPVSGATLCLSKPRVCYQMPSHQTDTSGVIYQFGLEPKSERLSLAGGGSWIFFTGTFSGGGSGTLERLAVLHYEREPTGGKIINLLPYIAVTNVSDRAMWTIPDISPYPILVRADFIWKKGETHFGLHYFTVDGWLFDEKSNQYIQSFSYQTKKRYDGGDNGSVHVLRPEHQEILQQLRSSQRRPTASSAPDADTRPLR